MFPVAVVVVVEFGVDEREKERLLRTFPVCFSVILMYQ